MKHRNKLLVAAGVAALLLLSFGTPGTPGTPNTKPGGVKDARIKIIGSACYLNGLEVRCDAIPGLLAPGTPVHVDPVQGSHGVVETLLAALEAAGFEPFVVE